MSKATQRRSMAVLTVGLAVIMVGCTPSAENPSPGEGTSQYREAEARYLEYSTIMHSVIMAIEPGAWTVDQGRWGAAAITCQQEGGERGYAFDWARQLQPAELDVDAVIEAASSAFAEAGLDVQTTTFGEGERKKVEVIGSGDGVGHGVVSMRPAVNQITVTATHGCFSGDALEITKMVFGGEVYEGASLRYPAVEGPDWQPRFYFPEEGSPVYVNPDGTPVDPQPVVSEWPVAPYGE